jgi:hypothetical protein
MAKPYKISTTGYYRVELNRVYPPDGRRGFRYKPGPVHTVNQAVLDAMLADDGCVASVTPA